MENCKFNGNFTCRKRKEYDAEKELKRHVKVMRAMNPEYWKVMDDFIKHQ